MIESSEGSRTPVAVDSHSHPNIARPVRTIRPFSDVVQAMVVDLVFRFEGLVQNVQLFVASSDGLQVPCPGQGRISSGIHPFQQSYVDRSNVAVVVVVAYVLGSIGPSDTSEIAAVFATAERQVDIVSSSDQNGAVLEIDANSNRQQKMFEPLEAP